MASAKLVSIGIPVLNESSRILGCVKSVLAQTYPDIEICISDNASIDGTYELVQELAQAHTNVRVMRQRENLEVTANFEAVRRMATGTYFMWLGADDRILPTYIERTVEQLESHPKATVAQSACYRVDDHGNAISEVRFEGAYNPNGSWPLLQALLTLTPFKALREKKLNLYVYGLYRKSILDRIMEQPECPVDAGDRVLPALAALSGGLRYVDEPLFSKLVHRRSFEERHPGDSIRSVRRDRTKYWNIVRWVFACPTIPVWRRWYGVIIAFPFLVDRAQEGLASLGIPRLIRTKSKF
jgi:glycosyltransferase involved in cell wall biosynthesis